MSVCRGHALIAQSVTTKPTRKAPCTTIALNAAYELVVVAADRPAYERMYASYRCVRFWTAMRCDDHREMIPELMRMRSIGLRATCVCTKTTGQARSAGSWGA